jgi:hypothetical protein
MNTTTTTYVHRGNAEDVAAAAERLIVDVEAGRVREARVGARKLNAVVHEAAAWRDGVAARDVAALRVRTEALAGLAARRAPPLALALAANRVRDLATEQAARGGDPALTALLRLGYLEREVELRSLAGQRVAAKAAAAAAASTWNLTRAAVAAVAGDRIADRFDRHVGRLEGHQGPAHLQDEARHGIELLVAIQRPFHEGVTASPRLAAAAA